MEPEGRRTATRNLPDPDPEKAAAVMRATANASTRTEKPVYHLSVSLAPGERLERPELERVADRLLQDLGLAEHQVLIAEHADGAQQHIHRMVNRVHPDTGRASASCSGATSPPTRATPSMSTCSAPSGSLPPMGWKTERIHDPSRSTERDESRR